MRKFIINLIFVICPLLISTNLFAQSFNSQSLVTANNQFTLRLFKTSKKATQNLVTSPYSVFSAFALLYPGAAGTTQAEINQVFGYPKSSLKLANELQQVNQNLLTRTKNTKNKLIIANAAWLQSNFSVNQSYQNFLKKHLNAKLFSVDFSQSSTASIAINNWVKQQTKNLITQLVSPAVISPQTRLLLINTAYFKGIWKNQFAVNKTNVNAKFYDANGQTTTAAMMQQTNTFPYSENKKLQILSLPYTGNHLSMIILLPKKGTTLGNIEKNLNLTQLNSWLSTMYARKVNVYLPRFNFSSTIDLNNQLKSLGLTNAFSPSQANFSNINKLNKLYISKVLQKAIIKVNEQGTKAAAATSISINTMAVVSVPQKPILFVANHPFIFLIKDNTNNLILFIGTVNEP